MVKFPSDEWIKRFKEEINNNSEYEELANDWEGDFLFVINPDSLFKKQVIFYIDLWHGKCRDAYLSNEDKKADFIFSGPYSNWKKVINKELDPIRGLIRGMFKVEGDSKIILEKSKAAQELVNTASKIPVEFEE